MFSNNWINWCHFTLGGISYLCIPVFVVWEELTSFVEVFLIRKKIHQPMFNACR